MIQSLANRMASFIAKNDETADQEVLAYGYGLLLFGAVTHAITFGTAIVFGLFTEMLVAVAVWSVMRLVIGGCHANSRLVCNIMYMGTLYMCIVLSKFITLNFHIIAALYALNIIILVLYAPGDTSQQPIVKGRSARKIAGIVLLSIFFLLSLLDINMPVETSIAVLVSTLTCLFLHPVIYRMFGCEKSQHTKENELE